MADAAEVAIEAALLAKAQAFATAQSLRIAMPNVQFPAEPIAKDAKWLRATFLPAEPETLSVSFDTVNRQYGLFQIDVFYGMGGGEIAPGRIASDIIAYFKRGTELVRDGFTVKILKTPYRWSIVKDDPWTMIPVRIPWTCFAPNPA